jgi:hypothetical protein
MDARALPDSPTCVDAGRIETPTATELAGVAEDSGAKNQTPDALVRAIRKLDLRLARNEDEAVAATIEKGQLLLDLKACANRGWGKRLGELGLNPRVASRLMSIGAWGREFGPIGSDLLGKLPRDAHKLEALAKLAPGPLRELVDDLDCREKPRASVLKAVEEVLGQVRPPAEAHGRGTSLGAIQKLLTRLIDQLDRLGPGVADGDATERIRGLRCAAFERLDQLGL